MIYPNLRTLPTFFLVNIASSMQPLPYSPQSCFTPLQRANKEILPQRNADPISTEGFCPRCAKHHRLYQTPQSKEIALKLMQQIKALSRIDVDLAPSEQTSPLLSAKRLSRSSGGKMFGVLLCKSPSQGVGYIKAFSGQFNRLWYVHGWVPPIQDAKAIQTAQEATEERIGEMSSQLVEIQESLLPLRSELRTISERYRPRINKQIENNHQRRNLRQVERAQLSDETNIKRNAFLNKQSRTDKEALRNLRREYELALQPINDKLQRLQERSSELKRARKKLSSELSQHLLSTYELRNFRNETKPMRDVFQGDGMPTGTGDCCAPKLLQFASRHNLKPIGLAEFWIGTPKT